MAGLSYGAFGAELELFGFLPAGKELAPGRMDVALLGAGVAPCLRVPPVFACAVTRLGRLVANSSGVVDARTESLLWASVGGEFGAELPLGAAVGLRPTVDIQASLTPYDFQVAGSNAYSSSALSVLLGLGFVWRTHP